MKVYVLKPEFNLEYPEQLSIIKKYLERCGELKIDDRTLESLYKEFCDDNWCAYWLEIKSEEENSSLLKSFAQWLSEYDI